MTPRRPHTKRTDRPDAFRIVAGRDHPETPPAPWPADYDVEIAEGEPDEKARPDWLAIILVSALFWAGVIGLWFGTR